MRSKQPHFMRFGPPIPIVPITHFSKQRLTRDQWADAWSLCGPSVERNMRGGFNRPPLELWKVIASAYLEGLHHGSQLMQELVTRDPQKPS